MVRAHVVWRGTADESLALVQAIHRWCRQAPDGSRCVIDGMGRLTSVCAAHRMLAEDQRALNGLLYARRVANLFLVGEFTQ